MEHRLCQPHSYLPFAVETEARGRTNCEFPVRVLILKAPTVSHLRRSLELFSVSAVWIISFRDIQCESEINPPFLLSLTGLGEGFGLFSQGLCTVTKVAPNENERNRDTKPKEKKGEEC
jgi:hypothetical protein